MDEPRLDDLLPLAVRLAGEAADMALPWRGRARSGRKADNSVVTETDHRIQAHIVEAVGRRYAGHAVIAEERLAPAAGRPEPASAEFCWVIDPIDGTRNFVADIPCFSTSIAVLHRGRPLVGVVYEHNVGRVWCAASGDGATLDKERIGVCDPNPAHDLLVGIPSGKDLWSQRVTAAWARDRNLVIRNLGSTAVHLALVASGALAAAFCKKCKIWDIAAGVLLVQEAGGKVTHGNGRALDRFDLGATVTDSIPILAAGPEIHERLLPGVQQAGGDA
jgi:myo-inositol-1(or 4)-monophosphatase